MVGFLVMYTLAVGLGGGIVGLLTGGAVGGRTYRGGVGLRGGGVSLRGGGIGLRGGGLGTGLSGGGALLGVSSGSGTNGSFGGE